MFSPLVPQIARRTFSSSEAPRTWTVDDDGPADFHTIQEAINAASDGDTIFVRNGVYCEDVVVNKTLFLVGESTASTILNGTTIEPTMIIEANDVNITGFTFEGWSFENIAIDGANGVVIAGNKIIFNAQGIDVENSSNVAIENNTINGNGLDNIGIMLSYSSDCKIVNNTVTNAIYDGIRLWFSNDNLLHGNLIEDNDCGIFLHESSRNTVSENTVSGSGGPGIYLESGSLNQRIFHNSFVDNTNQAVVFGGSTNYWDDGYPSSGNYWSDYNGTDADGDGIGDSPYVIDAGNSDNYPLMQPWASPDIAMTNASLSKTVVGQGFSLSVNANVANLGNKIEGFNLTAFVNMTALQMQYLTLKSGNSTVATFEWNTSSFAYGNYSLAAAAEALEGEILTENNNFTGGWIFVTIAGDLNGDQFVNAKDAVILGSAFNSTVGNPAWDANADINGNGRINGKDAVILRAHFDQSWS